MWRKPVQIIYNICMATRLVFMSDTHNFNHRVKVPEGDIIIHSGDATFAGSIEEISDFAVWYRSLPHKHKIFVAGNHDWLFERNRTLAESLIGGIIYLQDSEVTLHGLRIYGSPFQPSFGHWAFNLDTNAELADKWSDIPEGIDILVTHGPPYGYGDHITRQKWIYEPGVQNQEVREWVERVGCTELRKRVDVIKPKIHSFGHIHPGHGVYHGLEGTRFINASICDDGYACSNEPVVIDL